MSTVDELNGQRNDHGFGPNRGVEGVNGNVEGVNEGVGGPPDFSTIIAQQLQNLLPTMLSQVGNQGNVGNQNGNVVNENVQENVRNVIVDGNRVNLLWNHAMVGAGHAAYTDRFHELASGMVPPMEPKTLQKAVQVSGALTDEAVRNGLIKKVEKRENVGELSRDKNMRDDNKRTRTRNAFASTSNPIGRENTGHKTRRKSSKPSLLANNVVRIVETNGNQARGIAIMLEAEKLRQNPNINDEVLGEKPEEKVRQLKSAKAKEKEQKEKDVVRDFPKVFPDDLSGLPPVREIEFRIELIPRATPIEKSPYRLGHLPKLESCQDQLQVTPRTEGFISTSFIAFGALNCFVKKKDGSFKN
ncbi:hypothetical protein Tco_0348572 [Tanacetum coccineum]